MLLESFYLLLPFIYLFSIYSLILRNMVRRQIHHQHLVDFPISSAVDPLTCKQPFRYRLLQVILVAYAYRRKLKNSISSGHF